MANQGRVLPSHLRRPLPGSGPLHPDPYSSSLRPPHGGFSPFEMLPPLEVMEQKLSAQHIEIEKLANENRRLAATHVSLRQDLATAKHELQMVHVHILEVKSEKERLNRGFTDQISMMEAELQAAEGIKMELQQARNEAQNLVSARKELFAKVQKLTHDLKMAHSEAQQIPLLMSEHDSLRHEYQQCRAKYEHGKTLHRDRLEEIQGMEKNYIAMTREVDKLRAELTHSASFDPRSGLTHSGSIGYNGVQAGNYVSAQNAYSATHGGSSEGGPVGSAAGIASGSQFAPVGSGQFIDASRVPGYNPSRGMDYDAHRGHVAASYDLQKGHGGVGYDTLKGNTAPAYNAQKGPTGTLSDVQRWPAGPGYDAQRGPTVAGYDAQRGPTVAGYDAWRVPTGPGYDSQRGQAYDVQGGANTLQYDASSRSTAAGPQAYVSTTPTPSTRVGAENESAPRVGNPPHN